MSTIPSNQRPSSPLQFTLFGLILVTTLFAVLLGGTMTLGRLTGLGETRALTPCSCPHLS